jgi:hypothetical protein
MNTKRLVAILSITGASLCADQSANPQKGVVTVCMDSEPSVRVGVRALVSAMFARIGVRVEWRERASCPAGIGAVQVRLSHGSPGIHHSEALAFALPHQATIVVFVDAVNNSNDDGLPSVMAHVLVHEITHVLEGFNRHSATGIMKARWDYQDFRDMRHKPIPFAQEDVNLIHDSLKMPRVASATALTRVAVAGP